MVTSYPIEHIANRITAAKGVLQKIEAEAKEKGISEAELLDWKLIDDMARFARQIGFIAMTPRMIRTFDGSQFQDMDTNTASSFEDLYAFLDTALAEIADMPSDILENMDQKTVHFSFLPEGGVPAGMFFPGLLANMEFHITTMYDICRMKGFNLGKMDFLGMR